MWKCTYIETSAKRNLNIESIFEVKRDANYWKTGNKKILFFRKFLNWNNNELFIFNLRRKR